MAAFLESFFLQYGYAAVFSVLIACGFGVPIPEDITLVTGGIISGLGYTDVHIMVAVGMAGASASLKPRAEKISSWGPPGFAKDRPLDGV